MMTQKGRNGFVFPCCALGRAESLELTSHSGDAVGQSHTHNREGEPRPPLGQLPLGDKLYCSDLKLVSCSPLEPLHLV